MTTKAKPLVSILINNYNYDRYLAEAINSALEQTYTSIEVIVVDDGSTDTSPAIIASYGDLIKAIYQENQGQASAFNRGFAASQGEIICFLDADDIFHHEKIATVVKAWQENSQSEWFFHPLNLFNSENKAEQVNQSKLDLQPKQIQLQDVRLAVEKGKLGNPFNFPVPPTSGMCFRRSLAEKLLPMPIAEGIILNDSYLKFAALGISQGVTIDAELAYQRIHDRNLFTTLKNNPDVSLKERQTTAAIFLSTAYWLKVKFPTLARYADNLFAVGLALHWQLGARNSQCQSTIKNYYHKTQISSLIPIFSKSIYKYVRAL